MHLVSNLPPEATRSAGIRPRRPCRVDTRYTFSVYTRHGLLTLHLGRATL